MSTSPTYAIIMAGGIGSRFWPLSRTHNPKQFHDMLGLGFSLIQATYARFRAFLPAEQILIVSNQAYRDLILEHLPEVTDRELLLEPVGRNTAPCIAYAAFKVRQQHPDAVLIISPSDHLISNEAAFQADMNLAVELAASSKRLITIGIQPTHPNTGYGYIQYKDVSPAPEPGKEYYKVKTFTEKPSLEIAKNFIRSGDFVWNSGLFVFSVGAILGGLSQHLPEVHELFEEIEPALNTPDEAPRLADAYNRCKNISIDYGVMEKADNVFVVKSHFQWSDLGTWRSLYEEGTKDDKDNVLIGEVEGFNAYRNFVREDNPGKLVVIKNLENMIVVDTQDVLLICPLDQEQTIRNIVADVRKLRGESFL
jgi:mannose-1-phosphate guanylyltransferase